MSLYRGSTAARFYVGNTVATKVYIGTTVVWEDQTHYSAAGTYTYSIPSWSQRIDIVALGGGAGGGGGAWVNWLPGGNAASWSGVTLIRGTTIPLGTTSLTVTVGAGGSGGPPVANLGSPGAASSVSGAGITTITAAGGVYQGNLGQQGQSAGTFAFNGRTYTGGAGGVGNGGNGGAPGAGGAGGNGYSNRREPMNPGGSGGPGGVWIYPY